MSDEQILAYLIALKMMMRPDIMSASLVELRAIQQSYKMILDILPAPKWWQIGLRYVIWQVELEIAAVERIIDLMVGYTRAFGGPLTDIGVVFGTLPK